MGATASITIKSKKLIESNKLRMPQRHDNKSISEMNIKYETDPSKPRDHDQSFKQQYNGGKWSKEGELHTSFVTGDHSSLKGGTNLGTPEI